MFRFKLADALIELQARGAGAVQRQIGGIHSQLQSLVRMSSVGIGLGGVTGLAGGLGFAVKQAISAEQAFAGVAKTTGLSGKGLDDLREKINKLGAEMGGISNEELREIAQIGGQLGIPAESLAKFTEDIAKAKVALDITPEAAANAMSELNTQFKFGFDNVNKVTSAINELSNTTRASASDILEITRRLSGAGGVLGISIPEVLSLATSLKEAGVSSEVAGTAMSKLMLDISNSGEWKKYADVVGMTTSEFGRLAQLNPFEAIRRVVSELAGARGPEATRLLEDLEINDARGRGAILQLSNAFETLQRNIDNANKAFNEGTSIEKEYGIFSATTAAQLERLENNIKLAAGALGDSILPAINDTIEGFQSLTTHLQQNSQWWADYAAAVTGAVQKVSQAINDMLISLGFFSEGSEEGVQLALKMMENAKRNAEQSEGEDRATYLKHAIANAEEAIQNLQGMRERNPEAEAWRKQRLQLIGQQRDDLAAQLDQIKKVEAGEAHDMKENWLSGGKGGGLLKEAAKIPEVLRHGLEEEVVPLLDQVKSIPFLQERFGGGETQFPEPEEQRGGTYVSGPAQIWQQAMRSTFEKAQRNAARKAEEQRESMRKTMVDIRSEFGAQLKEIAKNTKGGAKAG